MIVNARLITLFAVRMHNRRTDGRYDRKKFPSVVIGVCDFLFRQDGRTHVARTHWTVGYENMWDAVESRENDYFMRCLSKCLGVPEANVRSAMMGDSASVRFFHWGGRIDVTPKQYLISCGQTRHMIRRFVWKGTERNG